MRTVGRWAEALQGNGEVSDAIGKIVQITGADVAGLCGYEIGAERAVNYAIFDRNAGQLFSSRRWEPIARELLCETLFSVKEASVLLMSELLLQSDFSARRQLSDGAGQGLKEVVIMILSNGEGGRHVLEFHYRLAPQPAGLAMLRLMSNALSRSWENRLPGIPRNPELRCVAANDDSVDVMPGWQILTHENPVGLSRTEFRICMLVRDGMKPAAISEALGVGEKTVRAHLSMIYSKVGVSGQFELLHRLIGRNDDHRIEMRDPIRKAVV